jgi:hypothetical protein
VLELLKKSIDEGSKPQTGQGKSASVRAELALAIAEGNALLTQMAAFGAKAPDVSARIEEAQKLLQKLP